MEVLIGKVKKGRVWELDVLRGIAVLAMVFDHLMFDLESLRYNFVNFSEANGFIRFLYKMGVAFEMSAFRRYGHFVFVALFLLLVGISCTFSKSNGKRAAEVALCASVIFVATKFLETIGVLDQPIVWGILQNISFNIVLFMTVKTLWNNKYFMLTVGAALILGGILIDFDNASAARIPANIKGFEKFAYFMKNLFADVVIGTKWYGPDHFGILPCAGVTLVGGYVGETWYKARRSLIPKLDGAWTRPFKFVGRHALIFYIAHQPATIAITMLLGIMAGLTPNM